MPLSLDEVASVSGETPAAATTLLNELTRMRLVFRSTASTCVVLPGVRDAIEAEMWRRRALEREQPSLFRLQDFQDEPWIAAICSVNRIEILRVSPSPAISVWTDCTVQTLLLQLCFGLTRPLTISRWVTGCRVTSEQAARRMG